MKTAVGVIGGKWKPVILYALKQEAMRFGELRRQDRGCTHKVLTEQLRELEADGIVKRTSVEGVPPGVEYSLTAYGETLRPVLNALAEWGALHRGRHSDTPLKGRTLYSRVLSQRSRKTPCRPGLP